MSLGCQWCELYMLCESGVRVVAATGDRAGEDAEMGEDDEEVGQVFPRGEGRMLRVCHSCHIMSMSLVSVCHAVTSVSLSVCYSVMSCPCLMCQCATQSHLLCQCATLSHLLCQCTTRSQVMCQCATQSHLLYQCVTRSHVSVCHSVTSCVNVPLGH